MTREVVKLLKNDFFFTRHPLPNKMAFFAAKKSFHMMIQFSDKLVPYEVFIKDLAREIVAQTTEVLREPNDIISQNKAFKLFGAGNVRRWVKEEKLIPVSKRPGKIEYRVFDLKRLQERQQDYFTSTKNI